MGHTNILISSCPLWKLPFLGLPMHRVSCIQPICISHLLDHDHHRGLGGCRAVLLRNMYIPIYNYIIYIYMHTYIILYSLCLLYTSMLKFPNPWMRPASAPTRQGLFVGDQRHGLPWNCVKDSRNSSTLWRMIQAVRLFVVFGQHRPTPTSKTLSVFWNRDTVWFILE